MPRAPRFGEVRAVAIDISTGGIGVHLISKSRLESSLYRDHGAISLVQGFRISLCGFGLKSRVNLGHFAGGSLHVEEVAGHFLAGGGEALGFCSVLQ